MTAPQDKTKTEGANTAVTAHGDHDRVQMLSLKADGTPDQLNPEMIGDKDVALKATTEQFVQQAISAADTAANVSEPSEAGPQDPSVATAQDEHAKVAKAAENAAEAAVNALHPDKG